LKRRSTEKREGERGEIMSEKEVETDIGNNGRIVGDKRSERCLAGGGNVFAARKCPQNGFCRRT